MTTLVLYDSQYGNTQKVAVTIAQTVNGNAISVKNFKEEMLNGLSLLIVGSPTHGGRPTPVLQQILNYTPNNALKNINVAVFDTRFLEKDLNFALRLLVKSIGYAAPKIAKILEGKGGKLVAPPEGFIVKSKEGPLTEGELDRAKNWTKKILKQL